MTPNTANPLWIRSGLALALALTVWAPVRSETSEPGEGKPMKHGQMMEQCEDLKQQKHQLRKDAKAQDAQLIKQIARMNRAPEDRKLDLLAAIITQMTDQRVALDARKSKMEAKMMKHMMKHMQMGGESMAGCPMMKKKMAASDHAPTGHVEHHEDRK